MLVRARAKVNLTLEVLEPGVNSNIPPGYHEVRTILSSIDLADTLHFSRGAKGISLTTDSPYLTSDGSNLVIKGAESFFNAAKLEPDVAIYLEKNIPMGAGLGGGSSDAAAALIGLNELYGTGFSVEELEKLARPIGADVPFCVRGGTAYAEGIGDSLEPLTNIPSSCLLLIIPPFSVETAWAYKSLDEWRTKAPRENENFSVKVRKLIEDKKWESIPMACANDFQGLLDIHYPILKKIREITLKEGVMGITLTGSGSALAAWVESKEKGSYIADRISLPVTTILTQISSYSNS